MSKIFLLDNPYKLIIQNCINIHYGNGAKNELKKENKQYNIKFYHKINNSIKFCSVGFNSFDEYIQFVKPINNKYYMFEYIFENKKCRPYFDYEYEINNKPTIKELSTNLSNIIDNVKEIFNDLFKIKLNNDFFIISASHGFKNNMKFKVSFHIIIQSYYFNSNKECEYICDFLNKKDNNFDMSVYSKDRLMRTVLSYKDWKDNRQFIAIDYKHNKIDIKIEHIENYLITHVNDKCVKLNVPIKIKRIVNVKKSPIKNNVIITNNEIGSKLEKIIQEKFHEDAYFVKSIIKDDSNISFYEFNYNDRNKKCFTGNKHDRIGFYCYIDECSNIILKCFSEHCKKSKYIIGNINETMTFEKSIKVDEKFITNSNETKNILNKLQRKLKTVVLKSSMGTGKTEMIIDYINRHKPKRILMISTRQSYANNVHKRLKEFNFTNYLDDKLNFHTKDRIIVQLESLHHLEREPIKVFDLIILDEIESILYHFSSDTIASINESTFNLLYALCKSKKTKIIAMDADYNIRAHEFVKDIGDYEIINNIYKKSETKIELTGNLNFFIDDIKKSIGNKLKICIIGLSTKILYQLTEIFDIMKVKYILHSRDSDDSLKKELTDVNKLWGQYQVCMFSPTISVGVDHTDKYFDKVYSIIISDCASPRTYLQMLGRIRNMKENRILTYYQGCNSAINKFMYNYEDMKEYFKYTSSIIATKKYEFDENGSMYSYIDESLFNKIMMYNKIENLNKTSEYFMTSLNQCCNDTNYKLVFIDKSKGVFSEIELNDDIYKDKIINANDINTSEYLNIANKINNNIATENEKFSFQKYRFKKFWKLDEVNDKLLNDYFRNEIVMNRLLMLLKIEVIDDDYLDYDVNEKIEVLNKIIKILGFDMNNLNIVLHADEYYKNINKLLTDSEFSKNYDKIRTLFNRPKTKLNVNMKGSGLAKFLNGFFEQFGMYIKCKETKKMIDIKRSSTMNYSLSINNKYINVIEKIKAENHQIYY